MLRTQRHKATRSALGRSGFRALAGLLLTAYLVASAGAATVIKENQLYEHLTQGDKSFEYYTLNVTDTGYSNQAFLMISAMIEGYDSDPDLFISKVSFAFHLIF